MALETSPEQPASVRVVSTSLQSWIERLGTIWVVGQVAQISRRPGMATVFMTLRDTLADVSVSVTAPRALVDALTMPLTEGAEVVVHAKPSFYANRGTLSLVARDIRMVGVGELLAQLERRRQLLAAEGLFARDLKRQPPFLPRAVGLITAPNSSAERDVVDNARRRWPAVEIVTAYAAMQGQRCVTEVVEALTRLDAHSEVDVIIIARGGGSVEDLLPFSDETLVRAVHATTTVVVSAIGHEPDTPLLDLVADVRASTPTDAAKMVVPDISTETLRITEARLRMRAGVRRFIDAEQAALTALRGRPVLASPLAVVNDRIEEVALLRERAQRTVQHRLDRAGDDVTSLRARVRSLSPLETLKRGYAVVTTQAGEVVATVSAIAPKTPLTVHVADGTIATVVEHTTISTTDQEQP